MANAKQENSAIEKEKVVKSLMKVIKQTLNREDRLKVSEWAAKYREIDVSAIKGRWSNDVTPFLVEIMDSVNDPYVEQVNIVKGAQLGGTEALINILLWIIDTKPSPTMIVYPDEELAKDTSTDRLKPAFNKCESVRNKFLENNSKELNLRFKGMNLYLRGSKSPSKLASKPVRYLIFDETDKMDGASKKEASPYSLAVERTKTYKHTRKIITCSTPTLKTNYTWRFHELFDEQRQYFVPCPHCNEMIKLEFGQIIFDKNEDNKLTNDERSKTARYVCQECGSVILDKDKPSMLKKGEWRAVKKKGQGRARSISYQIGSIYSIFVSWSDMAKKFLDTKDDPEEFQDFVNSWLGEPWEDTKLKTSAELVLDRQTNIEQFIVPSWTKMLTGGVDVQENCLYWTIRAWGDYITSQNIAHGQAQSFEDIERIMNMSYAKETGEQMMIQLCLVDSGDQTDMVYDFCYYNSDWAYPVKGSSNGMLSHYKLSTVNKPGTKEQGMTLVLVDGGKYKDMIAGRMRKENGRGSWMVYKECDMEYAQQVTAEHKVTVNKVLKWIPKTSHADNHYLDCEVYAFAAADILGVRSLYLQNEQQERQKADDSQYTPEETWIENNEKWI